MPVDSLIIGLGGYDVQWWHLAIAAVVGVAVLVGGFFAARRLWPIVSKWSRAQQVAVVAAVVVVLGGAGYAIAKALDRPEDVYNADIGFEEKTKKPKKPKEIKKVDWPVYGYDNARTRFLDTSRVNPPFHSSDWSFVAGTLLEFSPVIHEDRLFIVDKNARTIALNSNNGRKLWDRDVGGLSAASPAYADGRLFVVTLEPGDIQALDPETGKLLWERDLGARSETSPVVYGDETVIVGNESGTVFALDVKTGNTKWSIDTPDAVKGGIALEGGIAYFGNYAGELYAVRAKDGDIKWKSGTQGSSFGTSGRIYSTPAVAYGRVFVGSIDSRVYSFDAETGALAWSQSTGDWVYSAPAIAEAGDGPPTVYIGSKDKYVYALDAKTGAVRWKEFTGGILLGAPTVLGRIVYVGVLGPQNGTIGYNTQSGNEVFRHELGEYNPVTSDGEKLYLTGESQLRAFRPETEAEQRAERAAKKAGRSVRPRRRRRRRPRRPGPPRRTTS